MTTLRIRIREAEATKVNFEQLYFSSADVCNEISWSVSMYDYACTYLDLINVKKSYFHIKSDKKNFSNV